MTCMSSTAWTAAYSIYGAFKLAVRLMRGLSGTFSSHADDAALVVHTERALQCIISCFANASQLFGLEVSLKKTEVLYQPAPRDVYHPPDTTIGETELNSVQQFSYLGCTISSDARIDKELSRQ